MATVSSRILITIVVVQCAVVYAVPLDRQNEQRRQPLSTSLVGDFLTSLFRQTIYNRIESLLLDPGNESEEKNKIIESAVENYHRRQADSDLVVSAPQSSENVSDHTSALEEEEVDGEGSSSTMDPLQVDITEFSGLWIRDPLPIEEPKTLAATQARPSTGSNPTESSKEADSLLFETYKLSDLFSNERPAAES